MNYCCTFYHCKITWHHLPIGSFLSSWSRCRLEICLHFSSTEDVCAPRWSRCFKMECTFQHQSRQTPLQHNLLTQLWYFSRSQLKIRMWTLSDQTTEYLNHLHIKHSNFEHWPVSGHSWYKNKRAWISVKISSNRSRLNPEAISWPGGGNGREDDISSTSYLYSGTINLNVRNWKSLRQ